MAFITTTAASIASGGTINGDITITGDLKVEGGGSFTYDEILEGTLSVVNNDVSLIQRNTNSTNAFRPSLTLRTDSNGTAATGLGAGIEFNIEGTDLAAIHGVFGSDSNEGSLNFQTSANGTLTTAMTIDNAQQVGIGITPTSTLHISGGGGNGALQIAGDSITSHFYYGSNEDVYLRAGKSAGAIYLNDQNSGNVLMTGSGQVIIGHTAGVTTGSVTAPFQVLGTGGADTHVTFGRWSADATGSKLNFIKSRNASIDGNTVVQDNDELGIINFIGNDGSDDETIGAQIMARVEGTPGSNDMPTELVFSTTLNGESTPKERLYITNNGRMDLHTEGSSWPVGIYSYGDGQSSRIFLVASKGTKASPTDINADDYQLGGIEFYGRESSGNRMGGSMRSFTGGTWTSTSYPTYLTFNTVAASATSETERMRIDEAGDIEIGQTNFNPKIQAGSGSSNGNVGYSFRGDTDTGMSSGGEGNIIHFVTGASVRMILDNNSRVSISNNDQGESNNTVFGKSAFNVSGNNGSDYNVAVGELAMGTGSVSGASDNVAAGYATLTDITSGDNNVAVGSVAGENITTGSDNIFLGFAAGRLVTTQSNNIYIGKNSGKNIDGGGNNVAIGHQSMLSTGTAADNDASSNTAVGYGTLANITDGDKNVAIGEYSGLDLTTSSYNVLVGSMSGYEVTTNEGNVFLGYQAGKNTAGNYHYNIAIGMQSLLSAHTQSGTIAIGYKSLQNLTSGSANIAIGNEAMVVHTTGISNIAIGYGAMNDTDAGSNSLGSSNNTFIGVDSGGGTWEDTASQKNVAIGNESMDSALDGADDNTSVGYRSGSALTTGDNNVFFGSNSGLSVTTGENNVVIGHAAGDAMTTTSNTILIGKGAGSAINSADSNGTIAVGYQAGVNITEAVGSVIMGYQAGYNIQTNDYNVFIGYQAGFDADSADTDANFNAYVGALSGKNMDDGAGNTALGAYALYGSTSAGNDAANCVAIGVSALEDLTTGDDNVAVGGYSLRDVTTGANNTAVGRNTGDALTIGHSNVAIGASALSAEVTGYAITAVGYGAFSGANHDGSAGSAQLVSNTGVGYIAGGSTTTGHTNTFIGAYTAFGNTTGARNVALGYSAFYTPDEANDCVALGNDAFGGAQAGQAYSGVVAIGKDAVKGSGSTTTGVNGTVGIGMDALTALTTGAGNIAMGYVAATALTTGGDNIAIGYAALQAADGGESNNVVIGSGAGQSINNNDSDQNVFLGTYAGKGGTGSLIDTVAIGYNACDGTGNIGTADSIFIGSNAGGGAIASDASASNKNIGIGTSVMDAGMDGAIANTAIGYYALSSLTSGDDNVSLGHQAGYAITTGKDNVCIGAYAGNTITTGSENTILGHDCDVASDDNTNNVVIGHDLTATDKDNAVFIGNNTNHIENDFNADATWNYSSDERQKKDIKDDTLGLDFINDLRPVTYKHKSPSEFPKEWKAYDANDKRAMGGDKTIHGLIAQEVKQALDNQGVDTFGGWSVGDDGRQRISAEKMVMPLIKAVQELSAEVKSLKKQLEEK